MNINKAAKHVKYPLADDNYEKLNVLYFPRASWDNEHYDIQLKMRPLNSLLVIIHRKLCHKSENWKV